MPHFLYKAIDYNGAVVKGSIEAIDVDAATDNLSYGGLSIVELRKANDFLASVRKSFLARSIKRKDIVEFANNLSVMLKTGIPIVTALYDIAETTENAYLKQKINSISRQVEYGSRFSDAVAMHKEVFPEVFLHLIVVGEETGGLDKSLADVSMHLKKMDDLAEAIKSAMMYPIFAIVTTTGALLFWLTYVLPGTMSMFKGMGLTLPLPTRILLHMSNFAESYWYLILMTPVLFFLIIKALAKFEKTRYYVDLAKIRMPVMKHIVYNKLLALYSEQMRILSVAGITITRSMDIVARIIGNDVFKIAIESSLQDISAGSNISDAMKKHVVFPRMMTRMVFIGESSGSLDEQFGYLSEYYLKKLDDVAQRIGKMIEPIVIVIIGLMFVFMIVGLLMPIYDLVTKMK